MARGAGGAERQSAGRVGSASADPGAGGSLALRRDVVDLMLAHARRALPNECCGLLIGDADVIDRARTAT